MTPPATRRLGIDFISVFNLPPVEFVHLAADLGCQTISTTLYATDFNPYDFERWSLLTDAGLRREMRAAMTEHSVSIGMGEALSVMPGRDVRDHAPSLEIMAELGVTLLNTVSFETDDARAVEQIRLLADMAAPMGIAVGIEFTPSERIRDFATGVETVRRVDRPNVGLVLDTMHFARSGSTVAQLQSADPSIVRYIQLCDTRLTPWTSKHAYVEEAWFERLLPGDGEVPLADILAAVPRDRIVSVEIPRRSLLTGGLSVHEIMAPAVEAARALIARVDAVSPTPA